MTAPSSTSIAANSPEPGAFFCGGGDGGRAASSWRERRCLVLGSVDVGGSEGDGGGEGGRM